MWLIALITVIGFGVYFNKIGAKNFRRIMAFELYVDLAVDIVLVYMFASSGTLGGAMIGAIAGLMFNIMLFFMKRMNGWDELRTVTCSECKHSHREWVEHPGVGWWFFVPPPLRPKRRGVI
jgi:Na+(H+)/acetate symporter ActP